mgnify:CR=1
MLKMTDTYSEQAYAPNYLQCHQPQRNPIFRGEHILSDCHRTVFNAKGKRDSF